MTNKFFFVLIFQKQTLSTQDETYIPFKQPISSLRQTAGSQSRGFPEISVDYSVHHELELRPETQIISCCF